jgi:hypothetical protein
MLRRAALKPGSSIINHLSKLRTMNPPPVYRIYLPFETLHLDEAQTESGVICQTQL